jgi:Putative auto-transporter adhesin, head GIN domain
MNGRPSFVMALSMTLLLVTGCNVSIPGTVIGSGNSASEDRTLGEFHALNVSAAIRATVSVGSPQHITVTADDNILPMVSASVSNGELQLSMQGTVTTRTPVSVDIVVPALDSLTATSAARIDVTGLTADALKVVANSAGTISAAGQATSLNVNAESAGTADLANVPVQSVQANITSAGHALVNVSGSVTGTVHTAGLLTISGNPAQVSVDTDAAGQVIQN